MGFQAVLVCRPQPIIDGVSRGDQLLGPDGAISRFGLSRNTGDEDLSAMRTKHTIDLSEYTDRNLSRTVGGFGCIAESSVTFYRDDIVYEFD